METAGRESLKPDGCRSKLPDIDTKIGGEGMKLSDQGGSQCDAFGCQYFLPSLNPVSHEDRVQKQNRSIVSGLTSFCQALIDIIARRESSSFIRRPDILVTLNKPGGGGRFALSLSANSPRPLPPRRVGACPPMTVACQCLT